MFTLGHPGSRHVFMHLKLRGLANRNNPRDAKPGMHSAVKNIALDEHPRFKLVSAGCRNPDYDRPPVLKLIKIIMVVEPRKHVSFSHSVFIDVTPELRLRTWNQHAASLGEATTAIGRTSCLYPGYRKCCFLTIPSLATAIALTGL